MNDEDLDMLAWIRRKIAKLNEVENDLRRAQSELSELRQQRPSKEITQLALFGAYALMELSECHYSDTITVSKCAEAAGVLVIDGNKFVFSLPILGAAERVIESAEAADNE